MNPLALLTAPQGVQSGGAVIPSPKSAAQSALDSSGSYYTLGGGSTGSFSVGGGSQFNLLIIGGLALAALFFLRKR